MTPDPSHPAPLRTLSAPPVAAVQRRAPALAGVLSLGLLIGLCGAEEPAKVAETALQSGRPVGDRVPQFYVRAITGPLRHKSVCYVCRNGDRPVAMVLVRKVTPELPALLTKLDKVIDQNRAIGLRGFGVLLSEDQRDAVSLMQTLAFDNQLQMPLTVAPVQIDAPSGQNVHAEAVISVVLYKHERVIANYAYRAGELNAEEIEHVLAGVEKLIARD